MRMPATILWLFSLFLEVRGFARMPNARRLQTLSNRPFRLRSNSNIGPIGASSGLSMHMGHSHSHHHHHDHSHEEDHSVKDLSPQQIRAKRRRRFASIGFAALATLGVKITQRRPINKTDVLIFCMTTALLTLSEKMRRSVKRTVRKIQSFKQSILRHTTNPREWLSNVFGSTENNAEAGRNAEADQVTLFGGLVNLLLSAAKLIVGVTCNSAALIADAGHSMSDLFSDVITLWAVQLGRLPPDEDHPYGHGKFEAIGSLFLALTLLGTGLSVGASSYKKLLEILALQRLKGLNSLAGSAQVPSTPALLVALLSIVSKEWLYRITLQVGQKLNSQVVIANAWHHRSDAYSSVMALIAIGLAIYFPSLVAADAACGLLVAGMIAMTGTEIMGESIKQLTDTSNEYLVKKVRVMSETHARDDFGEVDMEVKRVRARQVGSLALVDVDIGIPGSLSSGESYKISESLRQKLLVDVADDVLDVEVHSGSTTQEERAGLDDEEGEDCSITMLQSQGRPSAADIESSVRCVLDSSDHSPAIEKVHSVAVKRDFEDSGDDVSTNVDVLLSVSYSDDLTVASLNDMSHSIRKSIETMDEIQKANLFFDFNAPISTTQLPLSNTERDVATNP